MPFLIDGHNLIGRMPEIGLADPDDEQKLVVLLRGYLVRTGKKGTVIFDRGQPGGADNWSNNVLKVRFAPSTSTADALILRDLAKNKEGRGLILVSDDQSLIQAANRVGAAVRSSAEFAREVAKDRIAARGTDEKPTATEADYWLKRFKAGK